MNNDPKKPYREKTKVHVATVKLTPEIHHFPILFDGLELARNRGSYTSWRGTASHPLPWAMFLDYKLVFDRSQEYEYNLDSASAKRRTFHETNQTLIWVKLNLKVRIVCWVKRRTLDASTI